MKTEFNSIWLKNLATISRSQQASAFFLLYDLILNRDPKKSGFTPVTNNIKLANGQRPWQGLEKASRDLYHLIKHHKNSLIEDLIKDQDLELLEQRRVAATAKKA